MILFENTLPETGPVDLKYGQQFVITFPCTVVFFFVFANLTPPYFAYLCADIGSKLIQWFWRKRLLIQWFWRKRLSIQWFWRKRLSIQWFWRKRLSIQWFWRPGVTEMTCSFWFRIRLVLSVVGCQHLYTYWANICIGR